MAGIWTSGNWESTHNTVCRLKLRSDFEEDGRGFEEEGAFLVKNQRLLFKKYTQNHDYLLKRNTQLLKRTGHSSSKMTLCPLTSFSRGRQSFPARKRSEWASFVSSLQKSVFPLPMCGILSYPFFLKKLATTRPQNGGQSHDKPNMDQADNGDRPELHEPGRSEGADEPCV